MDSQNDEEQPFANEVFSELFLAALGKFDWSRKCGATPLEGLETQVEHIILSFLAGKKGNHVLLEGTIGTAKTRLCENVAISLLGGRAISALRKIGHSPYERISGNPETRPSDILGADLPTEGNRLSFCDGPILNEYMVFYVDELNRMPSLTQAALLEAMEEGKVTVTSLDQNMFRERRLNMFFMLASQNPITDVGTELLPEAQLDRFMVKLNTPLPANLKKVICATKERIHGKDGKDPAATEQEPAATEHSEIDELLHSRVHTFSRDLIDRLSRRTKRKMSLNEAASPKIVQHVIKCIWGELPLDQTVSKSVFDTLGAQLSRLLNRDRQLVNQYFESEVTKFVMKTRFDLIVEPLIKSRKNQLAKYRESVAKIELSEDAAFFIQNLIIHLWDRDTLVKVNPDENFLFFPSRELRKYGSFIKRGPSPRGAERLRDLGKAVVWAKHVYCEESNSLSPNTGIKVEVKDLMEGSLLESCLAHRIELKRKRTLDEDNSEVFASDIVRKVAEIIRNEVVSDFLKQEAMAINAAPKQ